MFWFVIHDDMLRTSASNSYHEYAGALWGRYLGGRWCLDYWFKIYFNLSNEEWDDISENIKGDKDLYDLFDKLGIYYEYSGKIIRRGKIYNYRGEEIGTIDRRK